MGILMDDFATGRNVTALPASVSSFTWDTKVQDLLPEDWVLDQEWTTEKANLRDLLGHLTGLTRYCPRPNLPLTEADNLADMMVLTTGMTRPWISSGE